ncbi:EAL domain-containing protein [Rhodoferax mekongensis]|uniref:EAL domain-containing protein n=1 Tax=Rhodoferax mekongensis TaxID=3068341 RepID=UPI0028BD40AD|nr:EAL domain-containing protein [Rhodoferax sp. TBRC 17199]MDT7517085.1 EAL domain-containing protein [Rhodoferax sp. TBRC 17199]
MPQTAQQISNIKDLFQSWLNAIRESLVALLPLTLVGAVASVFAYLPNGPNVPEYISTISLSVASGAGLLMRATTGIIGLATAMVLAVRISARRSTRWAGDPSSLGGIAAVAAAGFLVAVLPLNGHDMRTLGFSSLLTGFAVGIGTAEILLVTSRIIPQHTNLRSISLLGLPLRPALRMSQQAIVVIGIIYLFRLLLEPAGRLADHVIILPFVELVQDVSPPPALVNFVLILINQLLWLIGCNGGQIILEIANYGDLTLIAGPNELLSLDKANPIFLNAFGHLGGAGATWGLIIAIFLGTKERTYRRLALISIAPAILNINELLLFGIPLVFSRIMLVPFIAAPMLCAAIGMVGLTIFDLPLNNTQVAWSTPALISGYWITGSMWGAVLQATGIIASAFLYFPFVRKLEQVQIERRKSTLKRSVQLLGKAFDQNVTLLNRTDELGNLSRALVSEFRQSIDKDEVLLVYQPQHDINGNIVGAEALLRWEHPLCGNVPPDIIVHLAEECDLIHKLGNKVLLRVCEDITKIRNRFNTCVPISVNMSPVQLDDHDWPRFISGSLKKYGLDPQDIELEVTEGRSLSSTPIANDVLKQLQHMGIKLAMDDFGMGYASLLYMQRFDVHAIKLDGCITRNITNEPVNQDIVKAVCDLGSTRGVLVVAEYVEDAAQRDMLYKLGCRHFQGWLYSRALPLDDFIDYFSQNIQQSNLHSISI